MKAPVIMKVFEPREDDDFAAYNDAEKWLSDLGYSVGSMERGSPTAAFVGDCGVSKWRNLDKQERGQIDAMIHDMGRGRLRGGSVEVVVYTLTPEMEQWAALLNT